MTNGRAGLDLRPSRAARFFLAARITPMYWDRFILAVFASFQVRSNSGLAAAQVAEAASYFVQAQEDFLGEQAGTDDLVAFLYITVVADVSLEEMGQAAVATPAPPWFENLSDAEQSFIRACQDHLRPIQRVL